LRLGGDGIPPLAVPPLAGATVTGISDRPWSQVSKASYPTADEYCAACIIDENAVGDPKAKARCKLPVYEPAQLGGMLNRSAVRAAAERLVQSRGGMRLSTAERQEAAQRLVALFGVMGEDPPGSLLGLAGRDGAQEPATGSWGALEP
jgi:hypothetical protein